MVIGAATNCSRPFIGATVLLLFVTAPVYTSCSERFETGLRAGSQIERSNAPALEFDLPDEYWTKSSDGSYVVTGFRVGYFRPNEPDPMFTVDFVRDAVRVTGRTARVSLHGQRRPENVGSLILRIQTLTRDTSSMWSEGSAPTNDLGTATRPRTREPRAPRRLSMSDVIQYPRLLDAMRQILPPNVKPEQVLTAYRNTDELAMAVVICREHGIALDKISQTVAGPPRRSLRNAMRELKPALRGSNSVQKARAAAKQLLEKAPPPQR